MDTKTIKATDLRAGDVVVEEDGFSLTRLTILDKGVEVHEGVVSGEVRHENGEILGAEWEADYELEVEREVPTTDLGAGGTVQAESFAVEVQLVNGKTEILPFRTSKYEHAERKVGRIERGIERGDYELWRQAYVVTADGTEV